MKKTIISVLIVILTLLVGGGAYIVFHKTFFKYTDSQFGFAFYYPKTWKVTNTDAGLVITNFGNTKSDEYPDHITVEKVEGTEVKVIDSHNGDTTLRFDDTTKQWVSNMPDERGRQVNHPVIPVFNTISGLPVFSSTGRIKTDIISLSHNRFLVLNIGTSGDTSVLDPFAKTFTEPNTAIPRKDVDVLVRIISNYERGPFIGGWLKGKSGKWMVAENKSFFAHKFALTFNEKSNCAYIYHEGGDFKEFPCLSDTPPTKWGVGDRVKVYGKIGDDTIEVLSMEIVSALPSSRW